MSSSHRANKGPNFYRNSVHNDSESSSDYSDFDEQTFGTGEDQPLVLAQDSVSLVSASTASSRGVPINQKKQFVVDIQAGGGIDNPDFSLATLAETNVTFYGAVGSNERTKFANLLARWKKTQRHEYNKLAIGSTPSNLQSPGRNPPVPSTVTHPLRSPPRSPPAVSRLRSPQPSPSPAYLHLAPPQPSPAARPFAPFPSIMSGSINDTLRGYLARAETVNVNTDLIEKNKPFRIVLRGNYKNAEGLVVNVYLITLPDLDPRWMARSPPAFELFLLPGTCECVAKIPAFDYAFLHDPQAEEDGKTSAGLADQGDVDAINISRNQVLANPERHWDYYRIVFPEILDNSVFSPTAVDGKVIPKVHTVTGKWTSTFAKADGSDVTKNFQSMRAQIQWKIAVHEDQKRHTAAYKANANELLDGSVFGSMSIS